MIATQIPAEWIGKRVIVTRTGIVDRAGRPSQYGNGTITGVLRAVDLDDPEWQSLTLGDMPDGSSGPFSAYQATVTVALAPALCNRYDAAGRVVRQSCGSGDCAECSVR
jgi:hypothetical protein